MIPFAQFSPENPVCTPSVFHNFDQQQYQYYFKIFCARSATSSMLIQAFSLRQLVIKMVSQFSPPLILINLLLWHKI